MKAQDPTPDDKARLKGIVESLSKSFEPVGPGLFAPKGMDWSAPIALHALLGLSPFQVVQATMDIPIASKLASTATVLDRNWGKWSSLMEHFRDWRSHGLLAAIQRAQDILYAMTKNPVALDSGPVHLILRAAHASMDLPSDLASGIGAYNDMIYCMARMDRAGRPFWVLDNNCSWALTSTSFPQDEIGLEDFSNWLKLPFDGMCLMTSDTSMVTPGTDDQALGLYLARTTITERAQNTEAPAIIGCAVGRRHGIFPFIIHPGMKPQRKNSWATLVLNFLMALNTRHLRTEYRVPKLPKSPGKQKKMARRGGLVDPHTYVTLPGGVKLYQGKKKTQDEQGRTSPKAHIVRGHWHCYWTKDPEEQVSLETRINLKGTVLHKVAKWLHPYRKGDPDAPLAETKHLVQYKVDPDQCFADIPDDEEDET